MTTDEEWKKKLTKEQYNVLRNKATESPFSGKYEKNKEQGMYTCSGCGIKLFSSKTKFDSDSGWPSFSEGDNIETKKDTSHGMQRIEILCKKCGGHLGHLFDDGPTSTKKRYCVNSVSLKFEKE